MSDETVKYTIEVTIEGKDDDFIHDFVTKLSEAVDKRQKRPWRVSAAKDGIWFDGQIGWDREKP